MTATLQLTEEANSFGKSHNSQIYDIAGSIGLCFEFGFLILQLISIA